MSESVVLVRRDRFHRYETPILWKDLVWDAENSSAGLSFSTMDEWSKHRDRAVFVAGEDGYARLLHRCWEA